MRLAQLLQYFRIMNSLKATIPVGSILPSIAPLAMTCPSGFEAYLAILGVCKSALKPAKLPKF